MTPRWRRLAAACCAVAIVASCSDDPDETSSSPVTSAPASGSASTPTTTPKTTQPATPATGQPPTTAPAATEPAATEPPAPRPDPVVALTTVAEVPGAVDLAVRPDDPSLYVVSQRGVIVAVRDGEVGAAPVLDISDLITTGGERGLLGLAFHPTEPLAYVDYTDVDGDTVIAEYAVTADGSLDAATARIVVSIDQPYANHNGGHLAFGPDGMLYVGTGDGGAGGDPERRALNVGELLGKMLRIDPRASTDAPYSVPADNPFVDQAGARGEVWSLGLRNPWRFSFDRTTGDLWIADVGQNTWEEIDVAWADEGGGRAVSFGWSAYEADERFNDDQPAEGHQPPIFAYDHAEGCSISGGVRYRGAAIPDLAGWFVFSDYCNGALRAIEVVGKEVGRALVLSDSSGSVSAVAEGPDGELYVLSLDGAVARIIPG